MNQSESFASRIKGGFTLIELVVTMAVSGIFFTLAMNLYSTANRTFLTDRKADDLYFEYNVAKAQTKRFLREHPEFCTTSDTEKYTDRPPLWPLHCKPLDKRRNLVYFRGFLDSTQHALVGFSTITEP